MMRISYSPGRCKPTLEASNRTNTKHPENQTPRTVGKERPAPTYSDVLRSGMAVDGSHRTAHVGVGRGGHALRIDLHYFGN